MTKDEALRFALEALETELAIDWTNNDEFNLSAEKMHETITAIKEALAQEQEPIRIMGFDCVCGRRMVVSAEQGVVPAPQRTWQGLTDEEIAQGCKESWITEEAWKSAVWWAEAKLKEKNT